MPYRNFIRVPLFLLLILTTLLAVSCQSGPKPPKKPKIEHSGPFLPMSTDPKDKLYPKIDPNNKGVSVEKVKALADNGNANAQLTMGKIYFEGLVGVKQDYRKAFRYFAKAANAGSPEGMYNVAICYHGGYGVRGGVNLDKALTWYRHAADRGVKEAQIKFAVWAESQGKAEEAFKYYKMLADAGDPNYMYQIGLCLLNGYGAPADPQGAVKYFYDAARKGNGPSQVRLADCYQKGHGVQQNFREMFTWLTLAAHDGDPEAQAKLGVCYRDGLGTVPNPETAFRWIKISADSKYPAGQYLLGNCYRNGIGTKVDERKAFENYKLAAESQDALAQMDLYDLYREGIGCKIDVDAGLTWLWKAAESGLPIAQAKLGAALAVGTDKQPANQKAAIEWLEKAQQAHDPLATVRVALCYLENNGIPVNRPKAQQLLREAMAAGSTEARHFYNFYFPSSGK